MQARVVSWMCVCDWWRCPAKGEARPSSIRLTPANRAKHLWLVHFDEQDPLGVRELPSAGCGLLSKEISFDGIMLRDRVGAVVPRAAAIHPGRIDHANLVQLAQILSGQRRGVVDRRGGARG